MMLRPDVRFAPTSSSSRQGAVREGILPETPRLKAHSGVSTRGGSWVRERALAARVRWLLARCVGGADGAARGAARGVREGLGYGWGGCTAGKRTRG
jgi:hypothetical protein